MFNSLPRPLQIGLAISLSTFGFGLTAIMIGFGWKSLSSDNVDLQIVNENLKVSAKLNEAKLVTKKAKEATDISKELLETIDKDVEEYKKFKAELLTEVQSIKGSYCTNQLQPLTEKIEAIESKPVISEGTEKTLEKVQASLEDAETSFEKLEQETEQEIKVKEEEIKSKEIEIIPKQEDV
ncbi:MAG: hypothetical protein QNJ41_12050 [Xenococcaceae cyanobacterium MO_188.B32]|nr:hypothetical protein [Xenococcaceae cyanobacterium MO_188.B32]